MSTIGILLAIEDEEIIHDLECRLDRLGYRVVGRAAGRDEIAARIEENNPDIVLTDIQLNGRKEGIKTGALIQSNFNKPVVYISGSIGHATVQRAKSTNPFGYIFEPFDDKQIYATIETALLRHQLEKELRRGRKWLNAVLNGINEGIIAVDHEGQISFMNPIAKELTGWNEMDTLDKSLEEVFQLFDENSLEVLNVSKEIERLNPSQSSKRLVGLLHSRYGTSTPIEAELNLIVEVDGMASGTVLVFRDIGKQRESFIEIERQSQRAQVLVETAGRLNAQLELEPVLETICSVCNQALHAESTIVFLEDGENLFGVKAYRSVLDGPEKVDGFYYKISANAFAAIVPEPKPIAIINNILELPDLPYKQLFKELNAQTAGIAGLYSQHVLIAVVISVFPKSSVQIPEDTLNLFQGLIDQATISIINANLFEQVRKGRESQRALTTRLVEVQETERRHLARELHDQIGQVLTGLQFMLESVKNRRETDLTNEINEAQETVSGLIEQIREMSLNLRPSMLDDIGLLPTLQWHFDRYTKQTGIKVIFHHNEIHERFSPEVETAVYRIIQEALTNIARYARVNEAYVQLVKQKVTLGIAIIDHGAGFDPSADGKRSITAGLTGMRERANMLGGNLVIKSVKEKGTQVLAMLPLGNEMVERRIHARDISAGG